MKKSTLLFLIIAGTSSSIALSEPIEWQPISSGNMGYNSGYTGNNNNNGYGTGTRSNGKGYKSPSGNQYQYDLNRHTDREMYKNDLPAQFLDKHDPRRNLDQNLGVNGGGIYNR